MRAPHFYIDNDTGFIERLLEGEKAWHKVSVLIKRTDIDGDGLEDAIVLVNSSFQCRWVVLLQTDLDEWTCAGMVGDCWYEHGFHDHNAPWPRIERHGGRVFIISWDGGYHQGSLFLHELSKDQLDELWREAVYAPGLGGTEQRLRLFQKDRDVIFESTLLKLKKDQSGIPHMEPVLVRHWKVLGNRAGLMPIVVEGTQQP